MRIFVILAVLLISINAHAGPTPPTDDNMGRFMNDKGMLARMEQVRQSVTEKASNLVVTSLGFLGVPYKRGGNSAETGFDCSGFVKAMYEQTIGLVLPRRAEQQAAATETIARDELQPGDLVFFNTLRRAFSHVGIYVGDGKFIHSPKPGAEVRVESLGVSYWSRRFDGARRVLHDSSEAILIKAQLLDGSQRVSRTVDTP
ncbi:C40 family peptidase [Rhodoferax sp. PAMC 29310]|uniref:C40 family peptidase n=1 Tax=Rhodoferax sp. PAMC 29310 TaxID=2822760 RepID=UPI001B3409E4|nr:C40 family peptidase [Rhodoferax sp. PAMC 29310]